MPTSGRISPRIPTRRSILLAGWAGASRILGGGASAWDNAATALEQGAGRVDMYVRRQHLPQINKGRGSASPGYFHGWSALDDAERWALFVYLNDVQAPPPHETVKRASAPACNSTLISASRSKSATRIDGKAVVRSRGERRAEGARLPHRRYGFPCRCRRHPGNRRSHAAFVARWRDRYDPLKTCSVRSSAISRIWGRVSNCWSESPAIVRSFSHPSRQSRRGIEPRRDCERHSGRQRGRRAGLRRPSSKACSREDIGAIRRRARSVRRTRTSGYAFLRSALNYSTNKCDACCLICGTTNPVSLSEE